MSEMVERVRASQRVFSYIEGVRRDAGKWFIVDQYDGSRVTEPIFPSNRAAIAEGERMNARSAIAAMREPTEAMKSVEGIHWGYSCHICGGLKEGWQAMIDEALKEDAP